ncbi:MAG: hypothetical protein IJX80_01275 [Clostridia bacterium]|nr:hypothetical protein [Clostridia bacterium]
MFQKDDYVFYGSGGICKISDVRTAPLDGMPADREYYVMQSIHDANGMIYVPVDSDKVFLRPILSRKEASALLDRIPHVDAIDEPNSKQLRARYVECMQTHVPEDWVRVIKTVWRRANADARRGQRISETERTMAENAKRYLHAELALALGLCERDMEEYITEHVQKMA